MLASESLRTTVVGPNPNFMPSSRFATSTPAVISTDMPMAVRPEKKSRRILAAIYARHHADLRIEQRRHNLAQIERSTSTSLSVVTRISCAAASAMR